MYLCLLALLEECILSLLLVTLLPSKVVLARNLIDLLRVNTSQINLVGSSDHVAGVDAAERDTVDLEGTGDEEDTLLEVLQENDALATETTSEEDEDGTGGKRFAGRRGSDSLADLEDRY